MKLLRRRAAAGAMAVLLAGFFGGAAQWARGDGDATDVPAEQSDAMEQARYDKITEFLLSEYARIGQSPDWLTRSLTTLSMARLPQSRANRALLKVLKEDASPAVQLVAWESLLARAKTVDPEQFETWMTLTPPLVAKGVFNGRLRVDLLKLLALSPPNEAAKKVFARIFDETNSLRTNDIPVIEELGHTLAAWKSGDLAKALIERMTNINDGYRAELVLKSAGCPVEWVGNRSDEGSVKMWTAGVKDYVSWWNKEKDNWKEKTAKPDGAPWRDMSASFLTVTLFDQEAVKANNPEIRKDLELGNPGLKGFDVAFVVDATESMQPPMDWLRDDLRKMMLVMGMMSSQPRIGITFYRDYYGWPKKRGPGVYGFVARTHPLTKNVDSLIAAMARTPAVGGGDDPEAVLEGMEDCVKHAGFDMTPPASQPATQGAPTAAAFQEDKTDRKVIILIGDAPPHPGTEKDCVAIATKAATLGFKIYAVKLTTPLGEDKGNLPSFDAIAAAGKGVSFAANFTGGGFEFRGTEPKRNGNIEYVWTAKTSEGGGPSKELLTRILLDAVNVKYRERIEMVVPILLEICEHPVPEVRKPFGPAAAVAAATTGPGPKKKPEAPVKHQQK